ncbi:MAG: extracellular solute-binding protein, partial [Clostridia bacterium]|nr:extracellular solute-binding protein [Clostridia bacterium]
LAMGLALGTATMFGFAACGGSEEGEGPSGPGVTGSGSISVHYSAGGFGKEVFNKLSADYKALTGVSVKWVPSYTTGEIQSLLTSNQEKNDIVMPLLNMYQAQDAHRLEDLTDVYNSTFEGETLPVKDKINQNLYEYIEAADGNRYQLFGNNSVSAFCYNIGTLDEAFGEGNWELPRTTAELVKMAGQLKTKGYYAFSTSSSINYYWDYIGTVWWAQYDGLESFQKYYYGEYWDEATSDWKLGVEINDTKGRRYALEALSTIMKKSNGYMHSLADRMGFEEAQAAFLSNGYVGDDTKCAFMVNGDWLENEMSSWLMSNPQDIAMMRAPVISNIIEKLSTVNTEAKLSEVVKAVDDGETSVAGVSDEDFQTVRNARLMCYTATPNYPIGIPANRPENKKKLAKDFLVYLYSDRAQKIFAGELQGLTYPTNYEPEDSVLSDFVRSRRTVFGNDMIPVFPINASPLAYRGGLGELPGISGQDKVLINGTQTVSSILSTCKTNLTKNWENLMRILNS